MNQQNQQEKPKRRRLIIAAIVLIAIVVVVIGVYVATRGGSGGTTPSPSVTPTPTSTVSGGGGTTPSAAVTPTPTATATVSGGGGGISPNIAEASSLQFSVSVTDSSGASQGTYTYYAKNAGTSNLMIRIEMTDSSGSNMVYIVNGALQKAWVETGDIWQDISSSYTTQWSTWNSAFVGYQNSLASWSGIGDSTYTSPTGDSVRVHNISVNPSLPDSLFTAS
jgi:hypothetical protein